MVECQVDSREELLERVEIAVAEIGFELSPALLDGVEFRRVRWQSDEVQVLAVGEFFHSRRAEVRRSVQNYDQIVSELFT